jgi:hypothetical protein
VDDLGGDIGTSNDDDVEDETYVDYGVYQRKMRHGKGLASNQGDSDANENGEEDEDDIGGQERDVGDECDEGHHIHHQHLSLDPMMTL